MSDISKASFWRNLFMKLLTIFAKSGGPNNRKESQKHQHVVPHEDGWAVRGEGNKRVTASYKYQDDAIKRAKDIAENYKSDLIIHGKDGRIRDRRSYD